MQKSVRFNSSSDFELQEIRRQFLSCFAIVVIKRDPELKLITDFLVWYIHYYLNLQW